MPSTLQPAPRASLADGVATQLREALAAGTFEVGTKLPTERELTESFRVGRTTIREAVRALAAEGLLVSRQGSGVFVAASTPLASLERRLSAASLLDVLNTRFALETHAARLAAENRDDAEVEALDALLRERDTHASGSPAFVAIDFDFHRAILVASKNGVLVDVFDALASRLADAFADVVEFELSDDILAEHTEGHHGIVRAIERRDADAAGRISGEILADTIRLVSRG
ncbi:MULTISPECIES: FadR/GntR family transcriptional regulator [Mycetocola]|uniref:FadR family transcriptional regulator n=1 Tax=Mycetocola lacteus TaxID=76637 RepID=A0A3L7ALN9_9MICO|nr:MULTISPECIES: FadR/GntR family transcriptional regulator [Mycetocola]MCS4275702.1 DNA-binding FadR family transcriptional regulator [Mycetocola sp. BIGb0189]RLP81359.1 FadR family transcriptional regulator [Mycetocola lacteus]